MDFSILNSAVLATLGTSVSWYPYGTAEEDAESVTVTISDPPSGDRLSDAPQTYRTVGAAASDFSTEPQMGDLFLIAGTRYKVSGVSKDDTGWMRITLRLE